MGRQNISTGGPWEGKLGYSRAVRVGASISRSGSTAMTPSGLVGKGDPYAQTIQTLKTIEAALQQAGPRWPMWSERACIWRTSINGRTSAGPMGKYLGLSGLRRRWWK